MSKPSMNIASVKRWFIGNSLPWDDKIEGKLLTLVVNCVEHLNECTQEEWNDLFALKLIITRRVAARVFASLKREGKLDPKKYASQLGVEQSQVAIPPLATLTKRGEIRDDSTTKKLIKACSRLSVKTVTKETNRKVRFGTEGGSTICRCSGDGR